MVGKGGLPRHLRMPIDPAGGNPPFPTMSLSPKCEILSQKVNGPHHLINFLTSMAKLNLCSVIPDLGANLPNFELFVARRPTSETRVSCNGMVIAKERAGVNK